MYFLETSAKASDNVERLFTEIAHELLQVSSTRDSSLKGKA
jgi:GTPase SAR1 family protein